MVDLVRDVAKMHGTQGTMLEQSLVGDPKKKLCCRARTIRASGVDMSSTF